METVIGILLLISFVGLVIYAVKGGNMALGVIIMATLWAPWRLSATLPQAQNFWPTMRSQAT